MRRAAEFEPESKAGVLAVRGQRLDVKLDRSGRFVVDLGTTNLYDASLEALRKRVSDHLRRAVAKVSVPATIVDSDGPRPVTLTGIHAGNRQITWREADGTAGAQTYGSFLAPLAPHDLEAYREMRATLDALRAQIREFEAAHEFPARAAVEEAILEAMAPDEEAAS